MVEIANFATLPTEILLLIISKVSSSGDVNAICKLTRRLHGLFLPEVFERRIAWAKTQTSKHPRKPRDTLVQIFLHAVKFNSSTLIQELFCYGEILDFRGNLPATSVSHLSVTFLHFAVTMDAPIIASQLMKHGSSSEFTLDSLSSTYPDLTPLYLSLARPNLLTQRELNAALRIACSYALPRTAAFLLARGAEARTISLYGISALHATLARRARWRFFDEFYAYMEPNFRPEELWEKFVLGTAQHLAVFGADPRLRTGSTRAHKCDAHCWKSVNCDHSAQSPIHLAASSGFVSVLRLLEHTVGPGVLEENDGEGYTPLYAACVQGNEEAALYILRKLNHISNPMVRENDGTTALHVACRFALEQVVAYLCDNGAAMDINRQDMMGRTPLHEVLSHVTFDREEEVIGTLHLLAKYGADPDREWTSTTRSFQSHTKVTDIQSPRKIAAKHAFLSVRDMFRFEKDNIYRDWCDEDKKENMRLIRDADLEKEMEPSPGSDDGNTQPVKKPRRKTKKQREVAAAREHEQNFPALKTPDAEIRKKGSGVVVFNPNLPKSLYVGAQESRSMHWKEQPAGVVGQVGLLNSIASIGSTFGKDNAGEQVVDSAVLGKVKGKGNGGKNKWKKMAL
ncbi:hypothetical protein VTL71DRAFT_13260 [Oculimacula yallundae]|uniref:Ankyrin n=1 Tax=Oculimacula yallundae TaxID=86028 RepID=A0ABR4CM54_9HELO